MNFKPRKHAKVREVAIGNASTLAEKRGKLLEKLAKMGADTARVLNAVGKVGVDDIGLEEVEILIGYGTAIKEGAKTVDELFPAPAKDLSGEQGKRMSLTKGKAKADAPKAAEPAKESAKPAPAGQKTLDIQIEREPGADDRGDEPTPEEMGS